MNRKTFAPAALGGFKLLDAGEAEGQFRATFATLNVLDRDEDVTLPGAFKDGQEVRIARWGHNWADLPVGKGVIHADEQSAWVDGEFFLDTTAGRDTYTTVKRLGDLQEWSYGFEILDSELGQHEGKDARVLKALDVFEVSPVMIGAGLNTRTDAIKAARAGCPACESKAGRRNSAKDADRIQAAHDLLAELGATCATKDTDSDTDAEHAKATAPAAKPEEPTRAKGEGFRGDALAARLAAELLEAGIGDSDD